jgi:hypothetical protein
MGSVSAEGKSSAWSADRYDEKKTAASAAKFAAGAIHVRFCTKMFFTT